MGSILSTMQTATEDQPEGDKSKGLTDSLQGRSHSPETPAKNPELKRPRVEYDNILTLIELPEEALYHIIHLLDAPNLCSLGAVSHRLSTLVKSCEDRWANLFAIDFPGHVTDVTKAAATLAGGWKNLYTARQMATNQVLPWETASEFEVKAAVTYMLTGDIDKLTTNSSPPAAAATENCVIIFLIDGSGSVTEEDFQCMTSFVNNACAQLVASYPGIVANSKEHDEALSAAAEPSTANAQQHPPSSSPPATSADNVNNNSNNNNKNHQIAIVQFSNDCRVELMPTELTAESLAEQGAVHAALTSIDRMNGGTNIAAAVQHAGVLFKGIENTSTRRVIALLTDGRIDSYQSREAGDMAARLSDEIGKVAMHAFGVGRGVDRHELLRIISPQNPDAAANQYLPLMVLEDAPW